MLTLHLPALRERGDDVLELARVFLGRLATLHSRPQAHLSAASLQFLRSHTWPGNLRELENVVQCSFLLSEGDEIDLAGADRGK